MQLIVTPVSGGQPVVLGFGSATSQGALNISEVVDNVIPTDLPLMVRNGRLVAVTWATLLASIPMGSGGSTGGGDAVLAGYDLSLIGNLALLPLNF